jgi:hypothetical protein
VRIKLNLVNENSHYLIVQRINDQKFTNRIDAPTDKKVIQKLINCLVGHVSVYLYNDNNSVKDLTEELGKVDKDIDFSKLYKISRIKYTRIQSIKNNVGTSEFFLLNLFVYTEEHIPKIIKYSGTICKKRVLFNMFQYDFLVNNTPFEIKRKIDAGADYERYIAKKYIDTGYKIIYNGIEKGMADEGIDLIATKGDKTILIQCKNWKNTGYKEIYAKDIKAFFGDCFKYILDNYLVYKTVGFHYIVAHEETINKSAINYLNSNTHIKYKCIPFEMDEFI